MGGFDSPGYMWETYRGIGGGRWIQENVFEPGYLNNYNFPRRTESTKVTCVMFSWRIAYNTPGT